MFVKICGLKTRAQIDKAIAYGYDAIGVVTCAKSKRDCPTEKAVELADYARGKIKSFVVGLTYDDVKKAAEAFDYIQIYEAIQLPNLVFSSKHRPPDNLDYKYFLYDASTGSGVFEEIPGWVKEIQNKVIVAGGLNKDNVCSVIKEIRPFGIDISSGVEKNGEKDFSLMKSFIDTARQCN